MKSSKILIYLFVLLIPALGLADNDNKKGKGHWKAQVKSRGLDRNSDGVITRAEWRGNEVSFRGRDINEDGVLSGNELRGQSSVSRTNSRFSLLDRNRNGVITLREWTGNRSTFNWLDRDDDDAITSFEFNNPPRDRENVFSAMDWNGDGLISQQEWAGNNTGSFSQFDYNRDGRVNTKEFFTQEWMSIMNRMLNNVLP